MPTKYGTHKIVEKFFDVRSEIYAYRAWLCSEAAKFDYRQTKHALLANLEQKADEKILEIGCGTGIWTKVVAEKCGKLTAIDISAGMLLAAKKYVNKKNVRFEKSDFLNYKTKERFDKIFAVRVLESFSNKGLAIRKMRELLKPSGRLVIITKTTPSIWDVSPKIRRLFAGFGFFRLRDADMPRVYVRNIGVGRLMQLLEKNGFSDLSLGFAVLRPPLFRKDDREIPVIRKPLEKAALGFFGCASKIAGCLPMPLKWVFYPFSESYVIRAIKGI